MLQNVCVTVMTMYLSYQMRLIFPDYFCYRVTNAVFPVSITDQENFVFVYLLAFQRLQHKINFFFINLATKMLRINIPILNFSVEVVC